MSSRRGAVAGGAVPKSLAGTGKPGGSRGGGGAAPVPPAPQPSAVSSMPSMPSQLGLAPPGTTGSTSKRYEGSPVQDPGTIKASRPASRTATASPGARAPTADFWSRSSAAQLLETSVKNPELKLQLLTRALEESRMKLQHLQRDRSALADALAQLCLTAGADAKAVRAAGSRPTTSASAARPATGASAAAARSSSSDEDSVMPRRLDLLSTQLTKLQETLRAREATLVEAEAAHERVAMQVVQQKQMREALEAQLEEARYTATQHELEQHAANVKLGLLEEQLGASAESARRRMEEQLDTFRGDATTARTLRHKFAELEAQLSTAQRAQHAETDRARHLAAQVERLQGRLKESTTKQAELSQQLWDKSGALNDLTAAHRTVLADNGALASENAQLREALGACQERAQRAENLNVSLQAQCTDVGQALEAVQMEGEHLRADLQQEREQKHRLQSAVAEEQLAGATLRAALQGKSDEVSSLLLKLEEYSNRIVRAEGALEGAGKEAEQAAAAQQVADEASKVARRENAALRDSLSDLAASEAKWRQQLAQAEAGLAEATATLTAQQEKGRQQAEVAAASKERIQRLQATLGEQSRQLDVMASLQQEVEGQKQQVEALKVDLRAATGRARAAEEATEAVETARQQAERELRKQQVVMTLLQEQAAKQAAEMRATGKEAAEVHRRAEEVQAEAEQQQERHAVEQAAQQQAHEQRKSRNEQLEHDNKQQAIIIAELQAACSTAAAELAAIQQHNLGLHRYAVAHGAAYGRLAAHTAGLHQQFARQLGGLRQMCRHLGLQLAAALAAADPTAGAAGLAGASAGEPAPTPSADLASSAATVAAAILCIESLRTEMHVALQLLDMQSSSSEAQALAAVPAGVAEALAADLAGVPDELLSSPRLERSRLPAIVSKLAARNAKFSPSVVALSAAAPSAAAAVQHQARMAPGSAAALTSTVQQRASTPPGPAALPPVQPMPPARQLSAALAASRAVPTSVLSAQMAQMEAHLERLVGSSTEQGARTAAAVQLHEQERAARQRVQELAADLASQLAAVQADLSATRGQRDGLDALSRRLARELRDAIYSLSQMCARQQGQTVSWAVRGLTNAGVQTQYCELWEANLGSGGGTNSRKTGVSSMCTTGTAGGSGDGSVLNSGQHTSGSGSNSDNGAAGSGADAVLPALAAVRVLPLAPLQQQVKEIYRAKAIHDLAVCRGQRAFLPLPDFVAAHLALQSGVEGRIVQQRAAQLQASVESHAAVHEVGMFGLAAGMLEEAAPGAGSMAAVHGAAPAWTATVPPGAGAGWAAGFASTAAAATVPLVLYQSRRCAGTAQQQQEAVVLPALRRFCAASWHGAYQRSAARQPLPQPFNPAAADQIHAMVSEVHNLALSVPGVEQLMCWVLGGGVGDCLPQMDLGLRLAENQVPQLYLLAVESCRLLGLACNPQIYVKSSSEAAAYYLLLPSNTRLHGFNGSSAALLQAEDSVRSGSGTSEASPLQASTCTSPPSTAGGSSSSGSKGSSETGLVLLQPGVLREASLGASLAALSAESQDWQCAVVLTSGLVDLLDPEELQAAVAGCLAFHAALTSPTGAGAAPGASLREAAQLAVLCRSMAALGTLGALCTLCPDALARRLPHDMAPFLHSRIHPLLRRSLRYLSLYCDRVAASVLGAWRPVACAVVKQAAGCAVLRDELKLEAVLQQAKELEEAGAELLPKAVLREDTASLAGTAVSLSLLRVRELQKWCAGNGPGRRW